MKVFTMHSNINLLYFWSVSITYEYLMPIVSGHFPLSLINRFNRTEHKYSARSLFFLRVQFIEDIHIKTTELFKMSV